MIKNHKLARNIAAVYGNYYCTDHWDLNVDYKNADDGSPKYFLTMFNLDNTEMMIPITKEKYEFLNFKKKQTDCIIRR